MSLKTLLQEEVEDQIRTLGHEDVGTEKYKTTVDGVTKLVDKVIELEKLEDSRLDKKDKKERQEYDAYIESEKMKSEKRGRFVSNCLTGLSIISSLALTVWGTYVSLEFEKEGTITTFAGRNMINSIFKRN